MTISNLKTRAQKTPQMLCTENGLQAMQNVQNAAGNMQFTVKQFLVFSSTRIYCITVSWRMRFSVVYHQGTALHSRHQNIFSICCTSTHTAQHNTYDNTPAVKGTTSCIYLALCGTSKHMTWIFRRQRPIICLICCINWDMVMLMAISKRETVSTINSCQPHKNVCI